MERGTKRSAASSIEEPGAEFGTKKRRRNRAANRAAAKANGADAASTPKIAEGFYEADRLIEGRGATPRIAWSIRCGKGCGDPVMNCSRGARAD